MVQELKNQIKSMNTTLNSLINFVKSLSTRLDKIEKRLKDL